MGKEYRFNVGTLRGTHGFKIEGGTRLAAELDHYTPAADVTRIAPECPDCRERLDDLQERGLAYDEEQLDPSLYRILEATDVDQSDTDADIMYGRIAEFCPKDDRLHFSHAGYIQKLDDVHIPLAQAPETPQTLTPRTGPNQI